MGMAVTSEMMASSGCVKFLQVLVLPDEFQVERAFLVSIRRIFHIRRSSVLTQTLKIWSGMA